MTDSNSPINIHIRFAALERRISQLEQGQSEHDTVIDPKGWIGEAFQVMDRDIDTFNAETMRRFDALEAKVDIILQHITGLTA